MATSPTRTIFLVEDDVDMRLLMRVSLRPDPRLDITAHAMSAEDAIELLGDHQPDLILLDHLLAGELRGLHAAPLLKRRAPRARVLLLSALDLRRDADAEPSVDAFLRKERMRDLLPTVQHLLGLDVLSGCRSATP